MYTGSAESTTVGDIHGANILWDVNRFNDGTVYQQRASGDDVNSLRTLSIAWSALIRRSSFTIKRQRKS